MACRCGSCKNIKKCSLKTFLLLVQLSLSCYFILLDIWLQTRDGYTVPYLSCFVWLNSIYFILQLICKWWCIWQLSLQVVRYTWKNFFFTADIDFCPLDLAKSTKDFTWNHWNNIFHLVHATKGCINMNIFIIIVIMSHVHTTTKGTLRSRIGARMAMPDQMTQACFENILAMGMGLYSVHLVDQIPSSTST